MNIEEWCRLLRRCSASNADAATGLMRLSGKFKKASDELREESKAAEFAVSLIEELARDEETRKILNGGLEK